MTAFTKLVVASGLTFGSWNSGFLETKEICTLSAIFLAPLVLMMKEIINDIQQLCNVTLLLGFILWACYGQASLLSFLSGGFGGMCLVLVGHPMDLLKVKLQTSQEFSGTLDCLRHIVQTEGPGGLYKGLMAPLIGTAPVFAICFWGYGVGQDLVCFAMGKSAEDLTLLEICFAGGFSAIPTTVVMAPMERIKCLLQTQSSSKGKKTEEIVSAAHPPKEAAEMPHFKGMTDCAVYLCRKYGLGSVFKGWEATLLRDIPGSVAYFFVYEVMKAALSGGDPANLSLWMALCAGGCAGVATWLVCIPADALKTRLQTAPEGKYTGILDVYRELMAEGGLSQFYTGITPVILRAFPANAACFFGVEAAHLAFSYFGLA